MNHLIKKMPNLDQEDDTGFTIFSKYLLMENIEICARLLDSGSNLNHININGKTPLHLAIECKKPKAIKFLVEKGANPHIEDFYHEDACDKAKKLPFDLEDNIMFVFLQCRPDKRIKTEITKVEEDHKEEEKKQREEEEGSSDDEHEPEDDHDQESMLAFDKQSVSSESETEGNSSMMMSGSSFWVSDMGSVSPSLFSGAKDTEYNSDKFL